MLIVFALMPTVKLSLIFFLKYTKAKFKFDCPPPQKNIICYSVLKGSMLFTCYTLFNILGEYQSHKQKK